MRSLSTARELCDHYHPGLLKALGDIPYARREVPGSPVIDLFRAHDGAGLLVPREYGGHGADALDAIRVQRALGSLSPSVAAAAAMHHFTTATLYALAVDPGRLTPAQLEVLSGIAPGRRLMASGWAEGRTQQNILVPAVSATPTEGGYLLNGTKKPCSLSRSMDLLTASIAVPGPDGAPELALAMVNLPARGLSVHPFWGNDVLAGAESDEVRLTDVFVPEELVVRTTAEDPGRLDDLQTVAFVWFELLISAAYVGAASTLAEQVVSRERGTAGERAALVIRVDSAFGLLEGAARAVLAGLGGEEAVAQVLVARYTVQDLLAQAVDQAVELLGGLDFIRSGDHARLATAVRALAFHPPGRGAAAEPLLAWFAGHPLELS
ncbi:acyl-CoA dehydrogenase family protein [Streptomyces sp. NBC_01264]|uniref:acyl-CoA dehydrogenase family protein n=1 Tax=Streptomyces sp. NBC_01264 TaxID=2903804 RepID=UPI00225A85D3|nr:acyl-CoA dehydrogenase family protein [Streptomyces sp. NBC_01264]MCX4782640.1 acyl-CoA/acyl-ACP dehydrogenase [Streptomyces sp. NBC_01264]